MPQQLSLNNIIAYLGTIASQYKTIKTFQYGPRWEFNQSNQAVYPVLWIEPQVSLVDQYYFDLKLDIWILDQPDRSDLNRQDIQSDAFGALLNIKAYIWRDLGIFGKHINPIKQADIKPIWESFDDYVEGWKMTLTLRVDWIADICNIPGLALTGSTFSFENSVFDVSLVGYLPLAGGNLTGPLYGPVISGGTFFSGSTPLQTIIQNLIDTFAVTGITADNGITQTRGNISLGGPLTGVTTIGTGNYYLTIPSLSATTITGTTLYDTNNNLTIAADARTLNDNNTFHGVSLDWDKRYMFDSGGMSAITFDVGAGTGRFLINSVGTTLYDFDRGIMYDNSGNFSIGQSVRRLFDFQPVESLDWGNRYLTDFFGTISIDWGNRILTDNNGDTELSWSSTGVTITTLSAGTFSASTIASGTTDLYKIFLPRSLSGTNGVILVGATGNITTGGTAQYPIISLVANPFFNNVSSSGTGTFNSITGTTISGATYYSGSTPLSTIIFNIATGATGVGGVQQVAGSGNILTGGTQSYPVISISASPSFNGGTFSGTVNANIVSATTLSASTYISGTTNLNNIFVQTGNTPNWNWQTLVDGSTVTWNAALGINAKLTLSGNRTLSITNPVSGYQYTLVVKQPSSGTSTNSGWTINSLPATSIVAGNGTGLTQFSTNSGSTDMMQAQYDGSIWYWTYANSLT